MFTAISAAPSTLSFFQRMESRHLEPNRSKIQLPAVAVPRSVPIKQQNLPSLTKEESSQTQPGEVRSPRRRMKIEDLLNHDDQPEERRHESDVSRAEPSMTSASPGSSYDRWTSRERSPSDGTSSLLEGSEDREENEDHDAGVHGDARENRPAYLIEEDTFIWYHRDDLGLKWDEVSAAFNAYFPQDRRRHGLQGIQGRYYRILKDEGVPKLRMRQKKRPRRDYGVIDRTTRRYPWMKRT